MILPELKYIRLYTPMMKRKIIVSLICISLLILLYGIIFSFSAQDAEESGSLSRMISEKCVDIINQLVRCDWNDAMRNSIAEYFEHPIRKMAHFAEYACMGILVFTLMFQWINNRKILYFIAVIWVFISAGADEFHQLFVPGRYGSFADVLLDTAGGLFGMFLCILIMKNPLFTKR